jgi:DNA mismatch repair protein MSH5
LLFKCQSQTDNGVRLVDKNALLSLQIFEDESHPNAHMQGRGGRGKEGLSLFGIMNYTRTLQGQHLLRQWFLRPSMSIPLIRERQDVISVLVRPDNSHVVEAIGKSLRMIKNIPKILVNLKAGKGEGSSTGNWKSLLQVCFSLRGGLC